MNLSNQALFQEGLDDLFDIITYQYTTDKIQEDWLFLLAQREKGRRRKMCGVERALALKGTTSSETENSSLKLCIENMFNTCSNNYITVSMYTILMIKMYCVLCTRHHDMILLCYM